MKNHDVIKTVGTYVVIGAASAAGSALWNHVLERKFSNLMAAIRQPKSDKIISFKQAKKRLGR